MAAEPSQRQPTLNEAARAAARARILAGARQALAEKGLGITVDDVVEAAGVGRRTIFRYFRTHEELIRAALEEIFTSYNTLTVTAPPQGCDLYEWLVDQLTRFHDAHERVLGQAFWGLYGMQAGSRSERAAWGGRFVTQRVDAARMLASLAWEAAGGVKEPPDWVIGAFGLYLSAFARNAMASAGVTSAADSAAFSARVLDAVVRRAVAAPGGG